MDDTTSLLFAPDGCTSEQHITQEVSQLLGHSRKCGGFTYHFEAILKRYLHKGVPVVSKHVSATTRKNDSVRAKAGVCCQTPQNTRFLDPPHKKIASVCWENTSAIETVPYSALDSPFIQAEEELRIRFVERLASQQLSSNADLNDMCEVRLHGGLLVVQCNVEQLTEDLCGIVKQYCKHSSDLQSFHEEQANTASTFHDTNEHSVQGAQLYTSKLSHQPINRKQFTQKLKQDPGLQACMRDNIAKHKKQPFCSRLQPGDFQHTDVIVPHWTTTDTIQKYVRAHALHHHTDTYSYTVKHAQSKKQWNVPYLHMHPCQSCQEVRVGSLVFWSPDIANTHRDIPLYRVANRLPSNNILVCGYAHQQPIRILLPNPFSITALKKTLSAAKLTTVNVDSTASHTLRFTSTQPRFTIWATSTCSEIFGFVTGHTYESTPQHDKQREYVLTAPQPASVLSLKNTVIRNDLQVHIRPISSSSLTTHIVDTNQCIPLRHTYAKDGATFAHLSAYQTFPIRYLTRERPQRGLLLYHEMGSGKSRTSIEMAQCDVEYKYWTASSQHRPKLTDDKPSIVLMSPTQEARDHFIEECALWLASRWTVETAGQKNTHHGDDSQWIPAQHRYTSFKPEALQTEIRRHTQHVLSFLKEHLFLFIVYTNNTNNLFRTITTFRRGCDQRSFSTEDQIELKRFFHRKCDDTDFQWNTRHLHPDKMYSRLFSDTFVIIDEMHNLCNSIASATDKTLSENSGTFFYRALMEAVDCQIVGLTGTPLQRTALSIAPLFNILRGKLIVCNVVLTHILSDEIREEVFASFRPFAHTVWADCKQTNHKNFTFSPWHTRSNLHTLELHIRTIRSQYKNGIQFEIRDTELFPFAFKYHKNSKQPKTYGYDNLTFMQKYVKNNEICNVAHFLLRVSGLVSYISPPKHTPTDGTSSNKNDEYPKYNIHTTHLSAHPSHLAYIRSIQAKKKKINQSKADVEQRSGCNVNWNSVPPQLRHGMEGVLKLFFKGNQEQVQSGETLEKSYHSLLHSMHTRFANPHSNENRALLPYLQINQKLSAFSPKIHHIVASMLSHRQQKSVVYSDFIDGVGKFGISQQSHSNAEKKEIMDEKHVGISGLGLLGYVLNANGYVQLKVCVHHPFEALHRELWKQFRNKRDLFLALGPSRCNSTETISLNSILRICKDLRLSLSKEECGWLETDVHWLHIGKSMRDVCRHCLMKEEFSPYFLMAHVQYRLSLSTTCRQQLFHTPSTTDTPPRIYAEYMDRTIHNTTSKLGKQCAKQTLLHLFNLRSQGQLNHLPLTDQAKEDFRRLLCNSSNPTRANTKQIRTTRKQQKRKHRKLSTRKQGTPNKTNKTPKHRGGVSDIGNANGCIIQTLLVSTSVTEGVEFKDVRKMHILEPPADYRKLEQMFGRVIRRGSHAGIGNITERAVDIYLYLLSGATSLEHVKQEAYGQQQSHLLTIDEYYWTRIIRNKYEISQEFYQVMKHGAVDCTHNLVLNGTTFQDRALTCFKYPYQRNLQDWVDHDVPMFSPLEDMHHESFSSNAHAIDLHKIKQMVQFYQ